MTKKEEFIAFVETLMKNSGVNEDMMPENVLSYWKGMKLNDTAEKPLFTDNGKLILGFLQEHQDRDMWKAKDIAEGLFISSKSVSGAIRKLVTDNYVEKVGENPSVYSITEKGKNIEIK